MSEDIFTLVNVNPPSSDLVDAGTLVTIADYGGIPAPNEAATLAQFAQAQFTYGQQIGVMDPLVYVYQALGVALASTGPQFLNTFGPSTPTHPASPAGDMQFVVDAYTNVFGHAGTQAQIQEFMGQLNFLETLYTSAGVFGDTANIDLLARGGVYGQMLGIEHEINPTAIIGIHMPTLTSPAV